MSIQNKKRKTESSSKVFLLFLFLFIFNLSLVTAEQQSLGYAQQNKCISLKQSFANSTYQNITAVTLPNKLNILVLNSNMTYLGGGLYNYTFCNTSAIGQYIVDGVGNVDGVPTTWTYDFYVTPLGIENSFIFYLLFILIIVLIFIVGFAVQNKWIMFLGSTLVIILGLFVVINGIDDVKNMTVTWAIGLVIWALGLYFVYLSVEEQLKEWD